jgi:DNA-binding CsgD family transcriptional regulator/PAS domain-containing protein
MRAISPERLSNLIGRIYDCAIEPDLWPQTMREICQDLRCLFGAILLFDLKYSRHRMIANWNAEDFARGSIGQHAEEITAIYRSTPSPMRSSLDEPLILSRDVPEAVYSKMPYYTEFIKPMGICDTIQSIVLRESNRIGVFAANRHDSVGMATDREIAIMRMLAPHLRRAVIISDLMGVKALEAHALSATLDNFQTGVIVVAADGRVLHANDAARRMFDEGGLVRSINGRLLAYEAKANDELTRALALACNNEAGIGANGIGIALNGASGEPAVAHVLPLAKGDLRTRLMPQATAAVFVSKSDNPLPADMSAIGRAFELTPAETRLLEHLVQGATLTDVSRVLGISLTTAKTHLSHIFSKTGVTRQADLIALVNRLTPQIKRPTVS